MNSIDKIHEDLLYSTKLLELALASCTDDTFNKRPAEGGWTIGEIMEHLWLIESSLNKQLDGTSNVTLREVDKKVAIIKMAFEEANKKYESPGFFVPADTLKNKIECLYNLQTERKQLSLLAATLDLSETLLSFKHPYLGALTRYEWVYFVILHSNRHLQQIINILKNNEHVEFGSD
ncbi:MAG: DinB family protein [Bacteroidota bacterium]